MSALQIISHPIHNVTERSGRNQEVEAWSFFGRRSIVGISKNKGKCSHRRSINYDKSSKKHQCVIEKYESNERSSVKILCHYLKIHPKTSIIKNYNARGKRCSGYRRKAR